MAGKINFVPLDPVSKQVLAGHKLYSHGLGLPEIGTRPVAERLAVLGGAPSLADHVEELRDWDGEIWAINEAIYWCRDHGIEATFYAIDPKEDHTSLADAIDRAVLADIVRPELFEALIAKGADVELFRIDELAHGSAAASTAPAVALRRGHTHVTLFGCTQSFTGMTHLYKDAVYHNYVWVEVDGVEYATTSQNIIQAEFIAELAIAFPQFLTVAGEGFLPALIQHGDYDVAHVCREIHEALQEKTA